MTLFACGEESRSRSGSRWKLATLSRTSPRRTISSTCKATVATCDWCSISPLPLQIALGYSYRDGDVISYAVPPRPDIVALASERRPIDTFGIDPLYTAYRVRGQTHTVSVSAGYALTKYLSVQVAYQYGSTSHDSLQYENHLVEAKLSFAY